MAKPEQSLEHIAKALQAIAKELTTIRRLMERSDRHALNIDARQPVDSEQVKACIRSATEQEGPTDGI